ncbi:MAG: hypothetical protein ABSC22_15740 [Roseiarcus sp.]|jgi:hypothetical protein
MIDSQSAARTLRRCAQLAAAAAVLVATSPAAKAQGLFYFFGGGPSPGQIERGLDASGYTLTGPLIRRGDVYLADVQAGRGDFERLVIDSQTGRIVERFRARPPHWRDAPPGDWSQRESNWWGSPQHPPVGYDRAPPSETLDVPGAGQPPRAPARDQVARGGEWPKPNVIPDAGATDAASPKLIKAPKAKPVDAKRNAAPPAPVVMTPSATPVAVTPPPVASPTVANQAPAANSPPPQPVKTDTPTNVMAEKSPPSADTPAPPASPKPKALNDLPVTPLD